MQQCDECAYRWQPCGDQYCRGYKVFVDPTPGFVGCDQCDAVRGGVRTVVVARWPEVYRAIARRLESEPDRVANANENGGSPGKASSLEDGASPG